MASNKRLFPPVHAKHDLSCRRGYPSSWQVILTKRDIPLIYGLTKRQAIFLTEAINSASEGRKYGK